MIIIVLAFVSLMVSIDATILVTALPVSMPPVAIDSNLFL